MYKITAVLLLVLFSVSLVGCATTPTMDPNYIAYLNAHQNQTQTMKQNVELFRLVSKDGETIEMKGVKEIVVNMPAAPIPAPKTYEAPPNETASIIKEVVKGAVSVSGYYFMGHAVEKVVDSIGKNSGHNTTYTNSNNDSSTGNYRGNTTGNIDASSGNFRNNGAGNIDASVGDNRNNTDRHDAINNTTTTNTTTSDSHDFVDSHNTTTTDRHDVINPTPVVPITPVIQITPIAAP